MVELTARNIVACIQAVKDEKADIIEVAAEAQEREWRTMVERRANEIWTKGDCATSNTYYVDRHGDTPTFRPELHPVAWLQGRRRPVPVDAFAIHRAAGRRVLVGEKG
jgi:hypothetical protein